MLRDDTGTEYADSIPGKAAWSQASSGQDVERAAGGQTQPGLIASLKGLRQDDLEKNGFYLAVSIVTLPHLKP